MRFRPFLWLAGLALLFELFLIFRFFMMRDIAIINVVNGVPDPDDLAAASEPESLNWIAVSATAAVLILSVWLDRRLWGSRQPR
jgi:hypothetical protein